MPRPLRSSCDRCHAQKLKCPKESGSASCSRCLKAGSSCVFSPAGPAWRRSANAFLEPHVIQGGIQGGGIQGGGIQGGGIQAGDDDDGLDFPLPWPPLFDLGDLPAADTDCLPASVSDPSNAATPQDPKSACVRQLSALAVEIHDAATESSDVANIHIAKGGDLAEFYSQYAIHVSQTQCIEKLLTLSQRLIDLYPEVLRLLTEKPRLYQEDCRDANCLHNSELLDEFAHVFDDPNSNSIHSPSASLVDTFVLGLVTSCHDKVADVLDHILGAAKFCARVTAASPDLTRPPLHIPELRVGSFKASATLASSMQATLFSHITAVLAENVKSLRRTVGDALGNDQARSLNKRSRMTTLQCELLEERSQLQAEQFNGLRDALMRCNIHNK
ncbi:hypothetical protein F4808DRAFT_338668 [Astrocystis sublimbata]|nr:hypothetical protein F4808DRAFT_338668 [Astrocystis sublimbata]